MKPRTLGLLLILVVLRTATAACRKKSSFVPGTAVLLATGETKPIEDVEVGDRVWATDPETGETGPRAVTQLISSAGAKVLVDVDVDGDGQADVSATDEHPFWVDNLHAWVDAIDLKPGDLLVTPDGATVDVDVTSHRHVGYQQVHNLTVDGVHTYHVAVGDESVLVHNAGGENCANFGGEFLDDSIRNLAPSGLLDDFADVGSGASLVRRVDVDGVPVSIKSGHGYRPDHGSVDITGVLGRDAVDSAVATDLATRVSAGTSVTRAGSGHSTFQTAVGGHTVEYRAVFVPATGRYEVGTYYIP